ncbi:hypothetical protein [Kitasatospora sp. GAS204B]|uniref:hypothetical protein n=1 Tax=unclassified Kitasatospora TaxID=2633591 RepID=UPI0024743520|nr:hypothetical protein [Kitasatospora sp. GAS204B]
MDATREVRQAAGARPTALTWPVAGPWSARLTVSRGGRPALEVYEHGELLDVVVASTLGGQLLRGARRAVVDGQRPTGFAWGRLDAAGRLPAVVFAGGRLRPLWRPAEPRELDGGFWLATAPGPLAGVVASWPDGHRERLRPSRAS